MTRTSRPRFARTCTRVLESARRAKRVVSDILVFTHQPVDKVLQSIDLAGVVREVVELYRRIAPGRRAHRGGHRGRTAARARRRGHAQPDRDQPVFQRHPGDGRGRRRTGRVARSRDRGRGRRCGPAGRGLRGLARAGHRARHGRTSRARRSSSRSSRPDRRARVPDSGSRSSTAWSRAWAAR